MAHISTDVNRPHIPADGATVTAEVDVEPGEQTETVQRQIVLCIDTSGSMGGEKLQRARDGASWVFGLLEPNDYVGIVGFESEATVVMKPTRWGDTSREEAMNLVENLSAGGGTDMYDGLATSRDQLTSLDYVSDAENPVRRILLLSDGKDNSHGPSDFADLATNVDGTGIRILAAGIGDEYDEETIRTLGTTARGEWTHLDAAGDIEEFFGEAVEQAGSVVAPEASLELDVKAGAEVSEVYRALPQTQEVDVEWTANTATVPLPDLAERENQRVVLKLHAPAGDLGTIETVADVTLSAQGATATDSIDLEYTDDNEKLGVHNEEVSLDHRQTVIRTELGKGNVEAAETQVERMTVVHGEDTRAVQEADRQTQLVKEGGREEQSQATKLVTDDDRLG